MPGPRRPGGIREVAEATLAGKEGAGDDGGLLAVLARSSDTGVCDTLLGEFAVSTDAQGQERQTLPRSYAWGPTGLLAVSTYDASGHLSATYQVIADAQGNAAALVDLASGQVAATYEYDPFGNLLSASGPAADSLPLRWGGGYSDGEDGLVYLLHRYYSPSLGRFTSRDPAGEGGGLNLYAYATNDPVNYADSDGLAPQPDWSLTALESPDHLCFTLPMARHMYEEARNRASYHDDIYQKDSSPDQLQASRYWGAVAGRWAGAVDRLLEQKHGADTQAAAARMNAEGYDPQYGRLWFENKNVSATFRFAWGATQVGLGIAASEVPWVGAAVASHGADDVMTAIRTWASDEEQRTSTSQVIERAANLAGIKGSNAVLIGELGDTAISSTITAWSLVRTIDAVRVAESGARTTAELASQADRLPPPRPIAGAEQEAVPPTIHSGAAAKGYPDIKVTPNGLGPALMKTPVFGPKMGHVKDESFGGVPEGVKDE